MTPTPNKNDESGWEEELHNAPFYKAMSASNQAGVAHFIHSLLAAQKAALIEEVEGKFHAECTSDCVQCATLNDVLTLLDKPTNGV